MQPSSNPSTVPTLMPTTQPSIQPVDRPSTQPTVQPTERPSSRPSQHPISRPSSQPSGQPSRMPSCQPQVRPSVQPTSQPSRKPTAKPIDNPSAQPTLQPFARPSSQPNSHPTSQPSRQPSSKPTTRTPRPTSQPTSCPSSLPSETPSSRPSCQPTSVPSTLPSTMPSAVPTRQPSSKPSSTPSILPSTSPSGVPSEQPRNQPSTRPSNQPTTDPSKQPSRQPSSQPSQQPTRQPTTQPTTRPTQSPTKTENHAYVPKATLPSLPYGLSVLGSYNQSFKIVLPFMHVSQSDGVAFSNVVLRKGVFGQHYVVFGGNNTERNVELSTLEYGKVFVMQNVASYDYNGRSVCILGDVNGDGHKDVIIGAPYDYKCYVLFGTAQGFMNMTEGFTIFGAQESDLTGWSVSGAGDVNNDTFADIIIGAPNTQASAGAVYIIYGQRTFVDIFLVSLNTSEGMIVRGVSAADYLGISVSAAGDVNGDGYDDIIMGAVITSELQRGAVYVIYGTKHTTSVVFNRLTATQGFTVAGKSYSLFGYSVSGAGDVNGDGLADIIVGSAPQRPNTKAYSVLIYGHKNTVVHPTSVSDITAEQGTVLTGGGVMVSGVGDINGDGFDDVMIGSNYDLSERAGLVVNTAVQNAANPSFSPTFKPTVRGETAKPSYRTTPRPSPLPSAVPSVEPTVKPSQPTTEPTAAGSDPTSVPSTRPSRPTVAPTVTPQPTVQPSMPTVSPSASPSLVPTLRPSTTVLTTAPTTNTPTVAATETASMHPTAYPTRVAVERRTFPPTNHTAAVDETIISDGGVIERVVPAVYVVNGTGFTVTFNGSVSTNIVGDVFVIVPNANLLVTISQFNSESDVIDLTHFTDIKSTADLTITRGSVIIDLNNNQIITLKNLNPEDINHSNFKFVVVAVTDDYSKHHFQSWDLVAGGVVITICILLVLACHFRYAIWWYVTSKRNAVTKRVKVLEYTRSSEEKENDTAVDNMESGAAHEEKSDGNDNISYESYLDEDEEAGSSRSYQTFDSQELLDDDHTNHQHENFIVHSDFGCKPTLSDDGCVFEGCNEASTLFHNMLHNYNPTAVEEEDSSECNSQGSYQTFDRENCMSTNVA